MFIVATITDVPISPNLILDLFDIVVCFLVHLSLSYSPYNSQRDVYVLLSYVKSSNGFPLSWEQILNSSCGLKASMIWSLFAFTSFYHPYYMSSPGSLCSCTSLAFAIPSAWNIFLSHSQWLVLSLHLYLQLLFTISERYNAWWALNFEATDMKADPSLHLGTIRDFILDHRVPKDYYKLTIVYQLLFNPADHKIGRSNLHSIVKASMEDK